jgi:competence protein CoiA
MIDATACTDRDWEAVHKVSPRAPLRCRACAHPMHAKVSPRGTRFFAHDRKVPDCPAAGETPTHRLLKGMLADAIRTAGWSAAVEATPGSGDVGGWRADVLAIDATTGRRVAFEVQLAALTIADARSRTARYSADEIPDDLADDT